VGIFPEITIVVKTVTAEDPDFVVSATLVAVTVTGVFAVSMGAV
jgi:hypothetical protein